MNNIVNIVGGGVADIAISFFKKKAKIESAFCEQAKAYRKVGAFHYSSNWIHMLLPLVLCKTFDTLCYKH